MPFERILVAIDGSECSDHALAKALELAVVGRARVTALAVEGRSRRTRRPSARSMK